MSRKRALRMLNLVQHQARPTFRNKKTEPYSIVNENTKNTKKKVVTHQNKDIFEKYYEANVNDNIILDDLITEGSIFLYHILNYF